MKIITLPNPILKKKCEPVTEVNDEIRKLLDDMLSTMYKAPGIGLAAPQIGISKRLIVMDVSPRAGLKRYQVEKDEKEEEIKPNPIQMINPEITCVSEKKDTDQEGCLSIPDVRLEVKRPEVITFKYQDQRGEEHTDQIGGLLSRAIQHEVDHLNGIFIVDRVSISTKLGVDKELKTIKKIIVTIK